MKLSKLLDERNQQLWDELNEFYSIQVQTWDRQHYHYKIFQNIVELSIPAATKSKEAFTHELLHLYLQMKGVDITGSLLQRLKEEPLLKWSFNENLFEQVGQHLEHAKTFQLYLSYGFDEQMFIEDEPPACTNLQMQRIAFGMYKPVPAASIIELFINRFYAMRSSSNMDNQYSGFLEDLQNINPVLFDILDQFWLNWSSFDLHTYHPVKNTHTGFTTSFMHGLGKWMVRNVHCKPEAV